MTAVHCLRRNRSGSSVIGRRKNFLIRTAGAAALLIASAAQAADGYSVEFKGAPDGLEETLAKVSVLARGDRSLPTAAAIRRLAREDVKTLKNALTAAGYYGANVSFSLQLGEGDEDKLVTFAIEPGPAFEVTTYKIVYSDEGDAKRPASLEALDIKADGSAEGARLQALQQQAMTALWDRGYPAAKMTARRADADLDAGTATAVFTFESGPRATFGDVEIDGALRTEPDFLRKLRTWEEGEEFERSKLVTYRDRLAATGLFGSIDVAPGAPDPATGAAPVIVTVDERKRRTIGAGLSYSTSEGPGGRLFFEYRNLFGAGETARVELEGNAVEQALQFDVRKPLPELPGEIFGQLGFTNETTDAFDARSVDIGAGLTKRWLDDRLETRGGVAFETSKIRQDDIEERTYFFSVPLSAVWNTEDDPLFLSRGERVALAVTPYTGSDTFTRAEFTARSRVNFGGGDQFTVAGRTRIGATFGSSLAGLPLNKRLYAGGGSSVRGFDFQAAGPLDADNDPIGGRSVVEAAIEARAKVTKNIQLAAFADAGNVDSNSLPDFTGNYFVGVGGGVRYFTAIGPIRADFAIPLDKRESDSDFQLYISLGQPF